MEPVLHGDTESDLYGIKLNYFINHIATSDGYIGQW